MHAAAIPADEKKRLDTLRDYSILQIPDGPDFAGLFGLAADYFEVSAVIIALIDNGPLWLKARDNARICRAEEHDGLSSNTVFELDHVLVVEDAERDPRFTDGPFVIVPAPVRFYAGIPIRAKSGERLGTLCIIDDKPRRFEPARQQYLTNLAAAAAEVLELHRTNEVFYAAANHDWLTGVCNRRGFEAAVKLALHGASDPNCAMMLVDLDGFKAVNDTFGHDAGDALLREVATRLCANARPADVIARLGGDEFAVLINGPLDIDSARSIAVRYLAALARHHSFLGHPIPVGASIGIAVAPFHGRAAVELQRAADQALYHAKRTGSQIAMPSGDAIAGPDVPPRQIDGMLQQALRDGDLQIEWRSFYDLQRGEMAGREAIAHWHAASEAEADKAPSNRDIDATVAPGTWLLDFACQSAATWQDRLPVVVNISSDWLLADDLTAVVRQSLACHSLAPDRLILQISERRLGCAFDRARERIIALQSLGVAFILSDFGISHASLMNIQKLPVDGVKPDDRLIAELGTNTKADATARALIALCHELHIQVHATGVANAEQAAFLHAAQCDYAQGPFLDPQFLLPDINAPLLNVA